MELVGRKQHGEHDYEEDVKIGTQPTIYHRSSFSTILRSYVVQQPVGEAASVPSLLFLSCFLTNLGDSMEHAEIFFERKKEAKLFLFASFLISKKVEGSLTNDLRSRFGSDTLRFLLFRRPPPERYIYTETARQATPAPPLCPVFPCLSNATHRERS